MERLESPYDYTFQKDLKKIGAHNFPWDKLSN